MFFKLQYVKWLLGTSGAYRFAQENFVIVLIGEMVIINRIKTKWRILIIYASLCF